MSRVQSDVKSALDYASLTQVGIIVVEIGVRLLLSALIHIIGHACLRTLQLLRAPTLLTDYHAMENALGERLPRQSRRMANFFTSRNQKVLVSLWITKEATWIPFWTGWYVSPSSPCFAGLIGKNADGPIGCRMNRPGVRSNRIASRRIEVERTTLIRGKIVVVMPELHFPWVECSILVPIVGALCVAFMRCRERLAPGRSFSARYRWR